MIDHIHWLGHGSFAIDGPPLIYINPWRLPRAERAADIILIGHDHYDHFSPPDIAKLRGPHTRIVANERVARELDGAACLRPWQSLCLDRVCIKAVPAYSPGDARHPQSDGGLGFVISINCYDIYYAGDTQLIPEMATIRPDIAILPIDGNGTLNVVEAAQATRQMRPRWVIPCNWGSSARHATRLEAQMFAGHVANEAEVRIMQPAGV